MKSRPLAEIEIVVMANPQRAVDAWVAATLCRKLEIQRELYPTRTGRFSCRTINESNSPKEA